MTLKSDEPNRKARRPARAGRRGKTSKPSRHASHRPTLSDFEAIALITTDYACIGHFLEDGSPALDWVSPSSTRLKGGSAAQALNWSSWFSMVHPDDKSLVTELISRTRSGKQASGEYRLLTPSGDVRRLRGTMQPVADRPGGRVTRFYAAARDVTDEARAEEQLQAAKQRYLAALDTSSFAVFVLDDAARFINANPASSKLLGYSREEILQLTLRDLLVPGEASIEEFWEALLKENLSEGVATFRHKDGHHVQIEYRARANALPGLHTMRDISGRNRGAEALSLLALVVRASHDAIVSADLDGKITSWNPAAERIFGYTAAEAIGRSTENSVPKHRLEEFKAIQERLRAGETVEYEAEHLRKDGSTVHVALTVAPIFDAAGKRIGNSAVLRDITERHRAAVSARQIREDIEASIERLGNTSPYGLTFRELTVLQLIARGRSDREIAEILNISPRTAQGHVTNILSKMQASSRTDAGVRGVREGFVK